MDQPQVTIDQLVEKYLELRTGLERIAEEAKQKSAPLAKAMEVISGVLMERAKRAGVQSFKTSSGTAFITTKTHCGVADWDRFIGFVQENGATNFLNKAVNKTAVQEYINAHEVPPPGVNWTVSKEIQVRRS